MFYGFITCFILIKNECEHRRKLKLGKQIEKGNKKQSQLKDLQWRLHCSKIRKCLFPDHGPRENIPAIFSSLQM